MIERATASSENLGRVGDIFGGRTILVSRADGSMGSELTEALVGLGARVHILRSGPRAAP